MFKFIYAPLILLCMFTSTASALYPIPEYEMVVVENVPKEVTLDMSLKQISNVKENSSFQEKKQKVYDVLVENLSPLLSEGFSDGYNLVEFAATLPAKKIMEELLGNERGRTTDEKADFIILVLPKLSSSQVSDSHNSYINLYSKNKAAVIDNNNVGIPAGGYAGAVNKRVQEAIAFTYKRYFQELGSNEAFFVGALIHLHLAGNNSSMRVQVAGSLPVEMNLPFEQKEDQAEFTSINLPKPPTFGLLYEDYPGAVIGVHYSVNDATPTKALINFGKLGKIEGNQWKMLRTLNELEDPESHPTGKFGIRSFAPQFNVPHLFGDIKEASGLGLLDRTLASLYNIQINIHQVELDLLDMRVLSMRTTIELPVKEHNWFTETLEPGLRWPNFEVPGITQKVVDGANQAIEPYREQAKFYMENAGKLLNDDATRTQFLGLVMEILENKTGGLQ